MKNRGNRLRLIFAARFLALLILFYVIVALNPVNDYAVVPFTEQITRAAAAVLRGLGSQVSSDGTRIASTRFAVDVRNGCNAVETMMLFGAAVLAFPASIRSKLLALLAGLPLIQIVNVGRVSSLFWLGDNHPRLFHLFHAAVWQSVMVLIGLAMFMFWSWKIAPRPAAHQP